MADPKVLYIIGKGRSGSTLLDNALGQMNGFFSGGEIWRRWRWRPLDTYQCGCGKDLARCPQWSTVIDAMRSTLEEELAGASLKDLVEWERAIFRWPSVPRLLRQKAGNLDAWPALGALSTVGRTLYRSLAAVSGARVIVDSSKWPLHPGLLGLIPGIEPYALHLIRDARAVAFSWRRRKVYPAYGLEMPRFGPVNSSISWMVRNAASEIACGQLRGRAMRMRYEDFVREPRTSFQRIVEMLGEPTVSLPFEDERTLRLGPTHTVMGNPSRFTTGPVEVRDDDEWKATMNRAQFALVSALTLPGLLRYGYSLRARRDADSR